MRPKKAKKDNKGKKKKANMHWKVAYSPNQASKGQKWAEMHPKVADSVLNGQKQSNMVQISSEQ